MAQQPLQGRVKTVAAHEQGVAAQPLPKPHLHQSGQVGGVQLRQLVVCVCVGRGGQGRGGVRCVARCRVRAACTARAREGGGEYTGVQLTVMKVAKAEL